MRGVKEREIGQCSSQLQTATMKGVKYRKATRLGLELPSGSLPFRALPLPFSITQGVKVPHSSLSMHENEKPSGLIPALSTKTGSMQNTELHHSQLLRGGCLEREVLPPFKTNESRLSFIKKPGSK